MPGLRLWLSKALERPGRSRQAPTSGSNFRSAEVPSRRDQDEDSQSGRAVLPPPAPASHVDASTARPQNEGMVMRARDPLRDGKGPHCSSATPADDGVHQTRSSSEVSAGDTSLEITAASVVEGEGANKSPETSSVFRPDFLTSSGPMSQLAGMDFSVRLPSRERIPVKVMLDTGIDYSVLMRPFAERHGYVIRPVREHDVITVYSPIVGQTVALNRWTEVQGWQCDQLGTEEFDINLYVADACRTEDIAVAAIFGRGVLQNRGVWDLMMTWMAEEKKKPHVAAPGIGLPNHKRNKSWFISVLTDALLLLTKRSPATEAKSKDDDAWKNRQQLSKEVLNQFESEANASSPSKQSSKSSYKGTSKSGKEDTATETATTVSSGLGKAEKKAEKKSK